MPLSLELTKPNLMADSSVPNPDNFQKSALYQEFLAEREEILRHKWIESEKVGHDIGFEKALLDWIVKHRANWRYLRQNRPSGPGRSTENRGASFLLV
jgi:hypothetical protein